MSPPPQLPCVSSWWAGLCPDSQLWFEHELGIKDPDFPSGAVPSLQGTDSLPIPSLHSSTCKTKMQPLRRTSPAAWVHQPSHSWDPSFGARLLCVPSPPAPAPTASCQHPSGEATRADLFNQKGGYWPTLGRCRATLRRRWPRLPSCLSREPRQGRGRRAEPGLEVFPLLSRRPASAGPRLLGNPGLSQELGALCVPLRPRALPCQRFFSWVPVPAHASRPSWS